MLYIPKLHTESQGNRLSGPREGNLLNDFYHTWVRRTSWSCDQNILYTHLLTYHLSLHIEFEFNWASGL